jgi:hypothetical protein
MRRQSRAASHRIHSIHRKTATPYYGSGVVGSRAATGTHKEISKTIQIATFLCATVFSVLSSMIRSFVPIGERHAAPLSFPHFPSRYSLSLFPPAFDRRVRLTEIAGIDHSEYVPLAQGCMTSTTAASGPLHAAAPSCPNWCFVSSQ